MIFLYTKHTEECPNFDIGLFWKLQFIHGSIVEHFKQQRVSFLLSRYLEIHKFSFDDSMSSRKMTFLYTKYIEESPNSNFGLFWKLEV